MGIAMYVEITAVGPYENARIRLQPDGTGSSLVQFDHAHGARV